MAEPRPAYWTGCEVTDYERKQRLLVPRKDEVLGTIVDLIPFDERHEFCVVDLGAGQGALSERILRRFERAHVVLFDASTEMLAVAAERLDRFAFRFSTMVGDFNRADWHRPIQREVHAVVSAIALHYLRTDRRAPFFSSVYELLQAPGYFANAGSFRTEHGYIQEYCDTKRLEHTKRRLLESEGRQVSLEWLRERRQAESQSAAVNVLGVDEQIVLLREAGFDHAEVVWRYLSMAVAVGYKGL